MVIEPGDIDHKVRRLQGLLKKKFRIETDDLRTGLKKAGRRLPRSVHKAGAVLAEAQTVAGHPKLARLADGEAVQRAFQTIEAHLTGIDVADRRKGALLSVLGSIAFNLISVFLLLMLVLWWRGLI